MYCRFRQEKKLNTRSVINWYINVSKPKTTPEIESAHKIFVEMSEYCSYCCSEMYVGHRLVGLLGEYMNLFCSRLCFGYKKRNAHRF